MKSSGHEAGTGPAGTEIPVTDLDLGAAAVGPAAEQVRLRLLEQMVVGQLAPGERLGAERDLAATFGVSRSTVRQALAALESAGFVARVPGRGGGTFVSHRKVERDLSQVVGVPALLQRQGMTGGSRVVSTATVPADAPTTRALGLEPGAYVLDIVRIRIADGDPLSLEHLRLPAQLFPGLLDLPLGGSVYELLETEFGVVAGEAVERIEVVPAGRHEAQILAVSPGAALLSISRTTRSVSGEPFEFSHDLFRADRTRITVHTPGRPVTASAGASRGHIVELHARRPR